MATVRKEEHEPGKQAVKFDGDKPRTDLLPARALRATADVFTYGSKKYDDPNDPSRWKQNWRTGTGMRDGQFDAAHERHRIAHNRGEDFDPETKYLHLAHMAANALMRLETFLRFPGTDDRDTAVRRLFKHRIALDIDDVCADTWSYLSSQVGEVALHHYPWPAVYKKAFFSQSEEDFMAIPPRINGKDLPFEPVGYVTARPEKLSVVTIDWLEKNNFPTAPVHCVSDKLSALRKLDATILIDDHPKYFFEALDAGVGAFLMDSPHNQKYNVGHKRIKSLHEVVQKI